jgi:hypothetical protein
MITTDATSVASRSWSFVFGSCASTQEAAPRHEGRARSGHAQGRHGGARGGGHRQGRHGPRPRKSGPNLIVDKVKERFIEKLGAEAWKALSENEQEEAVLVARAYCHNHLRRPCGTPSSRCFATRPAASTPRATACSSLRSSPSSTENVALWMNRKVYVHFLQLRITGL